MIRTQFTTALVFMGSLWLATASTAARAAIDAQAPPRAGTTVWDGVFSAEQAARGRIQYEQSCAACHGKDLAGDGTAPSLIEESFAFLFDDMTLGHLFDKIRSIMPPARPGSLSAESYCDVVAYLLQANKMPAGEKELPPDNDVLDKIRITKLKN